MRHSLALLAVLLSSGMVAFAAAPGADSVPVAANRAPPCIAAEYVLPAYVNLKTATLVVRRTDGQDGPPADLQLTFQAREGASRPCGELRATLKSAEERRLAVNIANWPDGDYRTEIRCLVQGRPQGEPLVRWLRKQTIPASAPTAEPIDVRGLTTLFVDDEYIQHQRGLRRAVNPAEPFAVTTGRLGPDRPIQKPVAGIRLETDGTWVVEFTDEEREDRQGTTRCHYTARSRDARTWTVTEDRPANSLPARAKTGLLPASGTPRIQSVSTSDQARRGADSGPRFRFYEPATDGPVNLRQVRLRHTGMGQDIRWGRLEMPYRTVYPVWERSADEHLVLTRHWLLRDKHDHPDGAAGDWHDTNDNFLHEFCSPDGRTIFYGQSRMILRHDPFRVPFDVFKTFRGGHYNRVMVVWRSEDGGHWTPSFFDPQREDDPLSYQGYGAQQFYAEGKRLSLCYYFAYRAVRQQVCVELRYSRDNRSWQRLPGHPDDNVFAANGPWGSWNFGYMFGVIGTPVEKHGEMFQLFASCQNVPHHFFRALLNFNPQVVADPQWLKQYFAGNDIPRYQFWPQMGGWEGFARQAPQACRPVGGMRYRKDGWVALKPVVHDGELVTKVLRGGERLAINARTRAGGQVQVELLDAAGRPLPDYSGASAARFTGDSVGARLAWKQGTQATLPRAPVRLRIHLEEADLFALCWEGTAARE
jgi:hypothetical protein